MCHKIRSLLSSKVLQKGLLFLLVCALLGGLISTLPLFDTFNRHWIDSTIRNNGLLGVAYFLLFSAGAMAIGCPRQVMAFLGGYAFGFMQGMTLSVAGAVIGCMLTFFVSRLLLRPLIKRRYAQRIHRINDFLQDQPISKTIVIRLLPVGNNLLTNLLAGVTNVKGRLRDWLYSTNGSVCADGQRNSGFVYLEDCLKYRAVLLFYRVKCALV